MRVRIQMFSDTVTAKEVFIISTHQWFLQNVVADRAMKVTINSFFKTTIIVAILRFRQATSHSQQDTGTNLFSYLFTYLLLLIVSLVQFSLIPNLVQFSLISNMHTRIQRYLLLVFTSFRLFKRVKYCLYFVFVLLS